MEANQPIYVKVDGASPSIRQGEILSDVIQLLVQPGTAVPKPDQEQSAGALSIPTRVARHAMCVVLSQDCDLESDYRARQSLLNPELESKKRLIQESKQLSSILLCEVVLAKDLKSSLGDDDGAAKSWDRVAKNNDFRFHVLEKVPQDNESLGQGLAALAVVFRRPFSVPTDDLLARIASGETKRRCYMSSPYYEHLSDRFVHYLGRIGLPRDHKVK